MSDQNTKTYETGTRIISEGESATNAYIVINGSVRVFLEKDGKSVTLATLHIGDMFGETALFGDNESYGAHVETAEDSELIIISPEDFKKNLETCDPIIRSIFGVLMNRLSKTNQALLESETREFMDLVLI